MDMFVWDSFELLSQLVLDTGPLRLLKMIYNIKELDKRSENINVRPKQVVSTSWILMKSLRTQETVPGRCRPIMTDPQLVKIVQNVCRLACILGLKGPNNQVSLNIKEHSAQYNGAHTRVGKAPHGAVSSK